LRIAIRLKIKAQKTGITQEVTDPRIIEKNLNTLEINRRLKRRRLENQTNFANIVKRKGITKVNVTQKITHETRIIRVIAHQDIFLTLEIKMILLQWILVN